MLKNNKLTAMLMIFLGMLCIIYPMASALAVNVVLGVSFIIGSFFIIFNYPNGKSFWDKAMYFVLAMVYLTAGAFMIFHPLVGIKILTIVLGVDFIFQGFFTLYYWSKAKAEKNVGIVLLINALLSIVIGFVLLSNIESGFWFIGLLVGINLIFTGGGLLMLGSKAESK